MPPNTTDTTIMQKLNIDVELLKQENSNSRQYFSKLDLAIERIGDVSIALSKMLALHEQKVIGLEDDVNTMSGVVNKFDSNITLVRHEIEQTIHEDRSSNEKRFTQIEKDVADLNKYKYYILSIVGVGILLLDNWDKISAIFK